ncbi:type II 3-dehydroquinate dehydratase [Salinispirillum marinum]|uniref:3-dehydroquinate dehydratase n=2 Tax=Saccharospirillaceae TaxID=255527 RepID=A0ABV8BI95_9GAMM
MPHIAVLHGPNLNMLGTREPTVYGHETLDDINTSLLTLGQALNVEVSCLQSNAEHVLIDHIHSLRGHCSAVIINPAAYTHTSVAIRDALAAAELPFVEVHLSNVHQREAFRHHSYFSDLALAVICGMGSEGYRAALRFLSQKF